MIKENSLRYSTGHQVQAKAAHGSHNPANGYDPVRYLLRLIQQRIRLQNKLDNVGAG